MVKLLLWRHAKSDWDTPELDDHERPLNKRGRRDREIMANRILRQQRHEPPGALGHARLAMEPKRAAQHVAWAGARGPRRLAGPGSGRRRAARLELERGGGTAEFTVGA